MSVLSGPAAPPLIVGVDIGGTKTHLRVQRGAATHDKVVASAGWRRRDWNEDARQILAMAAELADGVPIAALGVGAHGCDDAAECAAYQAAFENYFARPVAVVNDAELMPLAIGLDHQIGLVAGTGSIAVCRTATGRMLVAGGWGWIIGDEGSAASLVREAARAVAIHLDNDGLPDEPLCRLLFEALHIPSQARIGSTLAKLGGAANVGRHAHIVFEAADDGSELARSVIQGGGEALAMLVHTLDRRGAGATRVIAGGSVIVSQPPLWRAFAEALARLCGGRIAPILFSGQPVEGACRLAAQLLQTDMAAAHN